MIQVPLDSKNLETIALYAKMATDLMLEVTSALKHLPAE